MRVHTAAVPHEAVEEQRPEDAVAEVIASAGVAALIGDRDPVAVVAQAAGAAGRPFEHIDATGLLGLDFDRQVRGSWRGDAWEPGALTRMLESGGVFLLVHGEALLDDLRQRACRMLLTRTVLLRGPSTATDRIVTAAPATALFLHVDDHRPVLLQVYAQLKLFPRRIRIDVDGPPPPEHR